jgi:hypothetical protein
MKRLFPLVLLSLLGLAAGCKSSPTTIATLLNDPGQFDHKQVRVAGKVTHAISVLGYGGYQIDDGTGQITIVTKTNGAPREGAEVGVQGEFRSGYTLGTETVAAIIEKQRVLAK